jgi:hypothetical protein
MLFGNGLFMGSRYMLFGNGLFKNSEYCFFDCGTYWLVILPILEK